MSKIPQGEWTAIAARHAKGESISRIAETYGCTPPAIHYILKRSRQRAAQNSEQRVNGKPHLETSHAAQSKLRLVPQAQKTAVPEPPRSAGPGIELNGTREPTPAESRSPLERPVEPQPAREAVLPPTILTHPWAAPRCAPSRPPRGMVAISPKSTSKAASKSRQGMCL